MSYKAAQCLVWEECRYFVIPSDMDPNEIMVGDRQMSNRVLRTSAVVEGRRQSGTRDEP